MSLSAQTIRYYAMRHHMIAPYRDDKVVIRGKSAGLSSASYDLTIGHDLVLGVNPAYILAEFFKFGIPDAAQEQILADRLRANPPYTALAHTAEDLKMPFNVDAQVINKSSLARVFCQPDNTYIDPGFEGNLTLELTNHGPHPVEFKAGDPVVQVVFSFLDMPTERPYNSKYQHQTKAAHPARYENNDGSWTTETSDEVLQRHPIQGGAARQQEVRGSHRDGGEGGEVTEIEILVREAWKASLENGYDGLHEEPYIEACNLADQDLHIELWVNALGEEQHEVRFAELLATVKRLQENGL